MSSENDQTPLDAPRRVLNPSSVTVLTVMFWIYASNLHDGSRLLYARRHAKGPRLYVPMLNIVPNLIGVVICAYILMQRSWPGFASCSSIFVIDAISVSFGTASIVGILVTRAYYVWMRHRWLLYLGGVLIFATFAIGASALLVLPMHTKEHSTCQATIDARWLLAKFVIDIVTNVTLSGLYLYVLSRALREGFSTSLYAELRHEGLISMFLVVVSSIVTAIVVLLDLLPGNAVYVYGIDILINATLVNRMLCKRRGNGSCTSSTGEQQRICSVAE
ncbi:hypothetical protein THASP1DRAFT_24021 [Thamnocephalis sphaerospora]|uniref:Uncharacterized protein n=1 Tax=Thamnocephalis sphaerospora TaxID=78915 RepID=A0A4P9XPG1_9FUNG|nr:hypothetical protein THASP1DRAFT_24021 [Thamnocephalis sphaerospora]|eukprot:RKP07894.1 hypothetical protein THASP1DRAFT_24021 [Thamnocephalis sphaerospora]